MRLYNTLTRSVERFEPASSPVKLYVCGITPYDATHLGHAFTFVAFDVLIRYLRFRGHAVRYVQNVTDIDDPLFAKARELDLPYQELAERETAQYQQDMRVLNVLPPDSFPHAGEEIAAMVELVERLLTDGYAYRVDGYVYFDIATDPDFGELSKENEGSLLALARERGGDPDDPRRRRPLDFLLWRPAADDEPRFPSPWGEGLPGWHIECSTMALKYLGAPLDIHGGGADLIFPHHECEIAQSEAATGIRPFARFWMHTGMVFLGGEKMSKSLGNMVFVRDLAPRFGADAVRLYLSGCRYRASLHYDQSALAEAARFSQRLAAAATMPVELDGSELATYRARFQERLDDDLDTPGAIQVLDDLAGAIELASAGAGPEHLETAGGTEAQELLRELGGVLGLRLEKS